MVRMFRSKLESNICMRTYVNINYVLAYIIMLMETLAVKPQQIVMGLYVLMYINFSV